MEGLEGRRQTVLSTVPTAQSISQRQVAAAGDIPTHEGGDGHGTSFNRLNGPTYAFQTWQRTVIDVFSKWLEVFPIRNKEALTVAKVLVDRVFCRMGTPLSILSDREGKVDGQRFVSCFTLTKCARVPIIRPVMPR